LSLTSVTVASINLSDRQKSGEKISAIQVLLAKSLKELRQLSKIIHGEQLITEGLVPAIEQEINWLQRNEFYKVDFSHNLERPEQKNPEKDLFLYRLLQESINNIIKHSGADQIIIRVTFSDPELQMSIQDNGTGFDTEAEPLKQGGLGLLSMQKRIELLNGSMIIESEISLGTLITFSIPYP
jgi:signal transduction histidine kinase